MPERPIFDVDGLRVTPRRYVATPSGVQQEGLTVEVTVVGGDWLLSEADAERLHHALGAWLARGYLPGGTVTAPTWPATPATPLTREAAEEAVQRLKNQGTPESWSEGCPECAVHGHRRDCPVCRGVGVVLVSRRDPDEG